jgi:hypothetical protein
MTGPKNRLRRRCVVRCGLLLLVRVAFTVPGAVLGGTGHPHRQATSLAGVRAGVCVDVLGERAACTSADAVLKIVNCRAVSRWDPELVDAMVTNSDDLRALRRRATSHRLCLSSSPLG